MIGIAGRMWARAAENPTKTAIRSPRLDLDYQTLRDRSAVVAGAIRAHGLNPGDRVVFIAPTIAEFPIVYFGLHAAGVIPITMNTMATAAEISYVLDDSDAALVIAWTECTQSALKAAEAKGITFWEIAPGAVLDAEPLEQAHEPALDDTVVILYTSGTTGKPKGAQLTGRNLDAMATMMLPGIGFTPDERFGSALPLFHVYGQLVVMNMSLVNGASASLISPFDPVEVIETVARDKITVLAGVPTMWNAMLQAARSGTPVDFGTLRVASSGGAALPLEVLREFEERFNCSMIEGYGLTETASAATTHSLLVQQKPGTVGPAAPGVEIEVRDDQGRVVEPGVVGEIYVAGPVIMKGYWNRPEATAETIVDGWMRTGDLGHLDTDGYLTIVDRVKDLIIRGGYNVYPREVEEVLYEHPDVIEAAVIGVPDDHFGEEIAAAVVLRGGSDVTAPDLRAWTKERLSAYKVPRLYQFMTELPKGSTGKILKRGIDAEALAAQAVRGS